MDDKEKRSVGQRLLDTRQKILENIRQLQEMREKHYPKKPDINKEK